jgi:hypothetical protein
LDDQLRVGKYKRISDKGKRDECQIRKEQTKMNFSDEGKISRYGLRKEKNRART